MKSIVKIRQLRIRGGENPLARKRMDSLPRPHDEKFARVYPPKVQRAYVPTAREANASSFTLPAPYEAVDGGPFGSPDRLSDAAVFLISLSHRGS
jgi:hypothetical protein